MLAVIVTFPTLEKIAIFLLTLSVLVVLHEFGHFLIARRNGVRVTEFAVGMGPKLFGWTSPRSGTLYSIRALPIGGYCMMHGEDGKTSTAEQQREFRVSRSPDPENFQAKSPLARLGIIVAGPVANFILAYVILLLGTIAFGVASSTVQPVVGMVLPNSPAQAIGLQPGDRILQIDGTVIRSGDQLIAMIHRALGKRLDLVFENNGTRREVYVTPKPCDVPQLHGMGCIGFAPAAAYRRVGLIHAIASSGRDYLQIAGQTVGSLGLLFAHFHRYASQVSGPIGIGQVAITVEDFGWGPYLRLAALISFALGIFNLLPIPALDGGRAAFIIAELIRGRPVDPDKEAMVHIAGFALLMALMVIIAVHDISRIVEGRGVFN